MNRPVDSWATRQKDDVFSSPQEGKQGRKTKYAGILRRPSYEVKSLLLTLGKYNLRGLCCSLIVMVQPTQHGNSANLIRLVWRRSRTHRRLRHPLPKPLMGSGLIKVHRIGFEQPGELLFMKDQEVIQTFPSHTSQKAFTDGICLRRLVRRAKYFDATCCCHSCKIRAEFPVVISNQIFGGVSIRSCLS